MQENILNEELTNQIKELFDGRLIYPVELLYFSDKTTCETCDEAEKLLDELSSLSQKVLLRKYDLQDDQLNAEKYHIQQSPGLVIAGNDSAKPVDYGIRFYGLPSGYEFGSLIQAIIMVSRRDSGLDPSVRSQLTDLRKPVQLKVFVTPT